MMMLGRIRMKMSITSIEMDEKEKVLRMVDRIRMTMSNISNGMDD
jgi:hypothetical protein